MYQNMIIPPYYQQQRQMNPMGYFGQGVNVVTDGSVKFYNAVEDYEKTQQEEKLQQTKIIVGAAIVITIVLIARKLLKQQILL